MKPDRYSFQGNYDGLWIECRRFAHQAPMDTLCEKSDFALNLASLAFLDTTVIAARNAALPNSDVRVIGDHPGEHLVMVCGAEPAQIRIGVGENNEAPAASARRHNFSVFAVGSRTFVLEFFAALRKEYGDARLATVNWWFNTERGANLRTVPMEPPLPVYDAFYPWLTEGVENYLDRFLADRASVLFMMGPPGTGKTSLMRHMIYTRQLAATITYDEKLLSTDEIFVNFLCDSESGVLVVEDADLMVGSRESEGNKLISRFLNVSDGLIKTSGKKIVFTTNLGDFRHVDEALIRSGRCFDAIRFRPLSWLEARDAAIAAGIDPPRDGGDYTLADLFGSRHSTVELAAIGIGR
jgi:ATPase family protein associated with various cellular activities (AAA)